MSPKQTLFLCSSLLASSVMAEGPNRFVDPFIGTASGGNTFPGAVLPWGMVSVSPHTDLHAPSGYVHGQPWFYGLGLTHLSGTGCADLGSIVVTAVTGAVDPSPDGYRCVVKDQMANPGYWAGTMAGPALRAEATATIRTGTIRFTPLKSGAYAVLVDAGRSLGLLGGGEARWTSERELEGYNIGGGFCGEGNRHRVYFAARFSRSPEERGTWSGDTATSTLSARATDAAVGAWARFHGTPSSPLEVRIGISYVGTVNARQNLKVESTGRTFDSLRRQAARAWEQQLSRIRISGGSAADRTKFYTALYHCLIHPNIISDVNGEFPLFTKAGVGRNRSRPRYSVFSLWDTYRTLHPLLTLVYPERQSAIVKTMIDMFAESGWLPKWELGGNETHMMVGDGGGAVIAESYLKGIRDYDTLAAYAAMSKPLTTFTPDAEPMRPGYADFVRRGYIPADQDTTRIWWVWGPVSTALEYCYSDWAVSRVASALGRVSDSAEFSRRALFYRNLFDTSTGFLRPRKGNGQWLAPFDPIVTEGSGNWSGSGGPGYVEGNAWQYTWFVPHDVGGLAELFGGAERCARKLLRCFAEGRFTINNEPDIAYPYLFTYFPGFEQETPGLVRRIMDEQFGTGPGGLPGNDDAGAISAWYVFSALGFYPACPASAEYRLGIPRFREARILLRHEYYPGTSVVVRVKGPVSSFNRIAKTRWNSRELPSPKIDHAQMVRGGMLTFTTSE